MQKGFTLIELMIVVAVIAMLASIALPQYLNYSKKTAENACLGEAKAYVKVVSVALSQVPIDVVPLPPVGGSCLSYGTPPISLVDVFTAVARVPGSKGVSCVVNTSTCALTGS